jgi:hypothetical protein
MLPLKRGHRVQTVIDVTDSVRGKDGVVVRAEHRWVPHLHGILVSRRQLCEEAIEPFEKCCCCDAGSLKLEDEGKGMALKGLIEGGEDLAFKTVGIKKVRIRA